MLVNLAAVANADGKSLPIDLSLDFSDREEYGIEFFSPIFVKGAFTNIAGAVELCGSIKYTARYMCDRCGEWYESSDEVSFSELLKKELDKEQECDENPDVIFYEGYSVDISDIIFNNIYMNLPSKRLCREDCRGLCSKCGKNLNTSECDCVADSTDPRFDVLDNFFKS